MDSLVAAGALLCLVLSLLPAYAVVRRERRGLARPLTFFVAMTAIYFVVPMLLAFTDGTAYSSVPPVLLVAAANLCFVLAYQAHSLIPRRAQRPQTTDAAAVKNVALRLPRLPASALMFAYLAIGVLAGLLFYGVVGGLDYLCHLDLTGATTAGTTYFLWGMLLPKTAALASSANRKRFGLPFALVIAYVMLALFLVVLTGTRIFLLVAMIQAALVFHLAVRRLRPIVIGAFLAALLAVAVLYGEYRIESGTTACAGVSLPPVTIVLPGVEPPGATTETTPAAPPTSPTGPGFVERVTAKMTNPQYLRDRYTKNFVDSLDVFRRMYAIVPAHADYLGGSSFARLLLQPIPRAFRPAVPPPPQAITAAFTSPGGGNVFQLWAEAYLNFGPLGIMFVALGAGLAVAAATRSVDGHSDNLERSVYMALLITSMLLLYRGSFIGATSFALMDLIPVWVFFGLARARAQTRGPVASSLADVDHSPIHI